MKSNNDVESANVSQPREQASFRSSPSYSFNSLKEPDYEDSVDISKQFPWGVFDSFKRHESCSAGREVVDADGTSSLEKNIDVAALATANSPLSRRLKGRHLQMIAFGGSIGTGLFVASGKALAAGGPASLVISFSAIGFMLWCTVQSLGEMSVVFPVAGSFSAYSTRFLDPAWGFAMGWNYAMQWLVVFPLEVIAASITIDYWTDGAINHSVFVSIFLVAVISINLFGVRGYGEAEFVFAIIKVVAIIGFIILGIIINCGGGPNDGYMGGRYWNSPGAFNNGFKGLCSVLVTAAFSFSGTELVGLASAETANPRKSLPSAIKQVFWRITLFYVVSLTIVGLLVPYNDERLLTEGSANAAASPFVIAIRNAGIEVLPSIMNAIILVAVLSVGNSSVFGSSRTLAALADQGQAPNFLRYIDRRGRPLWAILIASLFGFIAYCADSNSSTIVLEWMLALSGLSSVFTWGSICLAHIRFRRAWRIQGHTLEELAFTSQGGLVASWMGLILNFLILVAQFWTGGWPVGYASLTTAERLRKFFLAYLAAPIVLTFFVGFKIWYKTSIVHCKNMDLTSGRRDWNVQRLVEQDRRERATWVKWKKVYKFFC